ncbi:MAG: hypothetical protein K2L03_04875, partial [Bacteroidales bacterium]|nr:hypothetical protein [Bacteroidales bacterium]
CDAAPRRNPRLQWLEVKADGSTALLVEAEQTVDVTPTVTTTYIAKNIPGGISLCNAHDTVTVVVMDEMTTELNLTDTNLCEPDYVEVAFLGSNKEIVSIVWTDSATGTVRSNDSSFVDLLDSTRTYILEVENTYGCTHRDTVHLLYGSQAYKLFMPDTAKCPGTEVEIHVSGPRPVDNIYTWLFPDSSIVQVTDSILTITTADTTERYVLDMLAPHETCHAEITIEMSKLGMSDTVMCDFTCLTLTLPSDTNGQRLATAQWFLLDSLTFSQNDTTVAQMKYTYIDTTVTVDTSYKNYERYHGRYIPYTGLVKETDTVHIHEFCDRIFTGGHTYVEFAGFWKENGNSTDSVMMFREVFTYQSARKVCREAAPGKKIVCDTVYDTYDG